MNTKTDQHGVCEILLDIRDSRDNGYRGGDYATVNIRWWVMTAIEYLMAYLDDLRHVVGHDDLVYHSTDGSRRNKFAPQEIDDGAFCMCL